MPLDSTPHLLPGLMPAQYAGVDFHMPDTTTIPGRRVAEHLFPGIDRAAYDDMGEAPEEITVTGILLGDDYIGQAQRLRRIMKSPGPKSLIHPWLGGMTVIMEYPGEISFADYELRVARFTASFKVIRSGGGSAGGSTSARLSQSVSRLISVSQILGEIRTPLSNRAIPRTIRIIREAFPDLPAFPVAGFLNSFDQANEARIEESVVTEGPVATAAGFTPAVPRETPEAVFKDLSKGAKTLVEAVPESPSNADRALLVSASGLVLARAAGMTVFHSYKSQAEALEIRETSTDLLHKLGEASNLPSGPSLVHYQSVAFEIERSCHELAAAVHDDINEVIGRLPPLHRVPLDRVTDAFLIAHHLFGDTLINVEAGYRSLVRRNDPRHPAQIQPGIVEVDK